MIQIEEIHIQELRGIRDLRLKLGSKSFVICGPNGSGKSGVVDAIDFAFTGSISRLTGAGSGGLTLLKHGPHVHCRDDPGAARVAVTFSDTASGKTAVLRRNVRTAKQYTLEPDIAEVRAAVEHQTCFIHTSGHKTTAGFLITSGPPDQHVRATPAAPGAPLARRDTVIDASSPRRRQARPGHASRCLM